jgi:hypothetical protein
VILVHLRDNQRGTPFLEEMWPGVTSIADPARSMYTDFGLRRGSLREMFGLDVWKAGLRAMGKGDSVGLPGGNVFTMPGMFLVDGPSVLWSHKYKHAGDQPDLDQMRAALVAPST